MKLLSAIYYFGIMACGIQGSKKAQRHAFLCCPASFLAALGGGMLRDLFILFVFPAALTKDSIPDIIFALCAGTLSYILSQKNAYMEALNHITCIADAFGLGTFIAMGVDRAIQFGASYSIAFICGIITALGGGILSSLLCNHSIYEVLTTSIGYRVTTIIGAFMYILCLYNGIDQATAQYWLILYTALFVLLTSCKSKPINFIMLLATFQCSAVLDIPTPKIIVLYKPYTQCTYFPQSLHSYPHDRCKKLPLKKYSVILPNLKCRFPHRFSCGR